MRVRLAYLMTLASLVAALAIIACGSSAPSAGGGEGSSSSTNTEAAKETTADKAQPDAGAAAEAAAAMAAGYIPAAEMAQHMDQEVTVQGTVKDYIRVTGSPGKPTLFLFEGAAAMTAGSKVSDLKTPGGSAVLIWREDSKNFPEGSKKEGFREFYKGKTICVTGKVEAFQDNTVIIAKDQSQIEPDC